MKDKINIFKEKFNNRFLPDEISIQNKLCNLIIGFTLLGTIATFFISLFLTPGIMTSIMVAVAIVIVSIALYLSAYKHTPTVAALIIILMINELVFPAMYYTCGGIHSGMALWFVVGLIFPFLVLEKRLCAFVFSLSSITLSTCFLLEYYGIIHPTPLEGFSYAGDIIQSMLLVALIFGAIFKLQTYIYTRQNNALIQKEAELLDTMKKLKEANAAKSDFLANMSHEIRTPINAIMGINEVIIRDSTDEDTITNSKRIQSASNNLLSLVNNILDFSKIESGKMEIICDNYSLSSVLNDCYTMISLRANNKNLKFTIVNDPDIPENLHGDKFHVFQVITNLLTNAVKYTNEGNVELNVSFEKKGDDQIDLIISVKDTGIGISEEDAGKLFTSFQRLDEKKNRTIEGTGLGLAITYRLVTQMGGSITVSSKLSEGSVFTVIIPQKVIGDAKSGPFSPEKEKTFDEPLKNEEHLVAPSAHILVVDDVKMNLIVVKGLLKNTQVQIDTASSGKEALELTDKNKYSLIFMDHMMPEMDGIETLRELKERKNINQYTPVVVLTANAIKGAEEEYKKAGFDNYLSKPAHGVDLEKMLLNYLPDSEVVK